MDNKNMLCPMYGCDWMPESFKFESTQDILEELIKIPGTVEKLAKHCDSAHPERMEWINSSMEYCADHLKYRDIERRMKHILETAEAFAAFLYAIAQTYEGEVRVSKNVLTEALSRPDSIPSTFRLGHYDDPDNPEITVLSFVPMSQREDS